MQNKHYLYRHIRLDKNEPFYIGVGTKTAADILYYTYTRGHIKDRRNIIWKRIIDKTDYEVEILIESDNYEFIKEKEQEFIKLYGRIDLKTGILANLTDGGEGTKNVVVSEKARKLRSLAHLGRTKSKESIQRQVETRKRNGFKQSKETIEKIRNSKATPVFQFSLKGEIIEEWASPKIAASSIGIESTIICACANTRNRKSFTAHSSIWVYKKDYESDNLEKFRIALDRVSLGKIKTAITLDQKQKIILEYIDIKSTFVKKGDKIDYLAGKFNLNYSTIRAIVYGL